MEFLSPVDIANRALQHCGAEMMDQFQGFTEDSKNARQTSFVYGKVRRAELRRNVWRFATRKAVMRPVDSNTLLLAPTLWVSTTTYFVGSLVTDAAGVMWQSTIPNNVNNLPQISTAWEPYFGPMTAMLYDSSQSYYAGEVVYTASGTGTSNVYISLVNGNTLDPSLPNQWSISTTYMKNQVVQQFRAWSSATTYVQGQAIVYTDGNVYASLTNGNLNNIPSVTAGTQWAQVPTITLGSLTVPAVSSVSPVPSTTTPVGEWNQTTTYSIGSIVLYNSQQFVSLANGNTGNFPLSYATPSAFWSLITGGTLFMSLVDLNLGNNPNLQAPLWTSLSSYASGNTVLGSDGLIYISLVNGNIGNNPVTDGGVHWQNSGFLGAWTTLFTQGAGNQQWRQIGGAGFPMGVGLVELNIIYPLGTGPLTDTRTKNIFRLPAGYLREAPRDPKQGSESFLGAPGGLEYEDFNFEGNYITSWEVRPIIFRFVADVQDVTAFDDMFCEGLACRIAEEVIPILTQSEAKLQGILGIYKAFMTEARLVNGIETGPTEPPEDDFITTRR